MVIDAVGAEAELMITLLAASLAGCSLVTVTMFNRKFPERKDFLKEFKRKRGSKAKDPNVAYKIAVKQYNESGICLKYSRILFLFVILTTFFSLAAPWQTIGYLTYIGSIIGFPIALLLLFYSFHSRVFGSWW